MYGIAVFDALPYQRPDGTRIPAEAGATVTVYNLLPDGRPSVDANGNVASTAQKALLFGNTTLTSLYGNPFGLDQRGPAPTGGNFDTMRASFIALEGTYSVLVTSARGISCGLPYVACHGNADARVVWDTGTTWADKYAADVATAAVSSNIFMWSSASGVASATQPQLCRCSTTSGNAVVTNINPSTTTLGVQPTSTWNFVLPQATPSTGIQITTVDSTTQFTLTGGTPSATSSGAVGIVQPNYTGLFNQASPGIYHFDMTGTAAANTNIATWVTENIPNAQGAGDPYVAAANETATSVWGRVSVLDAIFNYTLNAHPNPDAKAGIALGYCDQNDATILSTPNFPMVALYAKLDSTTSWELLMCKGGAQTATVLPLTGVTAPTVSKATAIRLVYAPSAKIVVAYVGGVEGGRITDFSGNKAPAPGDSTTKCGMSMFYQMGMATPANNDMVVYISHPRRRTLRWT